MTDRDEDVSMPEQPPTAPPPVTPEAVTLESQSEVRSGGIGGRIVAGALGLVLLVGGVAFAATQMASDDEGTPVEAVEQLFEAIGQEDVLGVLASLDPRERDALSQPVRDLFEQLERLEVLDESFELSGVEGIDLSFTGLEFEQVEVRDDLFRVYLTGGTASYAVDTDEIPVGAFLADNLDRFGVEYQGIQDSGTEELDPAELDDTFLVARKTDDGWRVSLGYTAVEAARLDMGKPVPSVGGGLTPIGADSPDEAVEGFLQALVDVDIDGAVARLSPGEVGALQDYWRVLVAEADLPTQDDVPFDIELTDLVLRSETDDDRGRVFIDSIGADVVADGFAGGATIADGCIEVRGDVRTALEEAPFDVPAGPICQDDIEAIIEEAMAGTADMGLGLGAFGELGVGDGDVPALGITVVNVDGGWFVAPLGTYADLAIAVLETFDREDLDAMVDAVEGFFGSGFFSGGDLGGGFVPPGMGGSFEEFEELGEPLVPDAAMDVDAVLEEMVTAFAGDPAVAGCTLEQLHLSATSDQLFELVDAYQYGYEPSVEAQDVLFAALTACGG